jgi:hypothetical protein
VEQIARFVPEPLLGVLRFGPATIKLQLPGRAVVLVYRTWGNVEISATSGDWENWNGPRLWLYDEIDVAWAPFGMFVHRVLLSSGEVFEIPFSDVELIEVSAPKGKPEA